MRSGLETLIASSPGMEVVGAFPDLAPIEALRPDVVLSASAPEEPSPPLVFLSAEAQPQWTQELARLGVRAVLPRYHFSPGEAGGRKVRTMVQLPFEFTLVR